MKYDNHKGMKVLKRPIKRTFGGWVEMHYDAKLVRFGITWYRAKNGFGDNGIREDWVADVPSVCVSVSDRHWKDPAFGIRYGSFNKACAGQIRQGFEVAKRKAVELKAQASEARKAAAILKLATTKPPTD